MRAFRNSAANVAASLARRPICSLTIEKNGQFAAKREWQSDGANPLHFSRSRSRGDDRNRRRKRVHLFVQTRKITTSSSDPRELEVHSSLCRSGRLDDSCFC